MLGKIKIWIVNKEVRFIYIMKEVKIEDGVYIFKLDKLLNERGITKTKLVKDTGTDFKVIKRISTGNLIRIDIYVLARLCHYLNCEPKDIIEFKRKK